MAGISDLFGRLNLGLALWNGRDPILKERMFGLTNSEGNHGEDVKEYWWYLDALPSSAWLRWRYHYPQAAFPYEDLIEENGRRSKLQPEYELLDTGIFDDDRYWIVEVHYAKADPTDILARITVRNRGPEAASIHVLPTLWFRNEWSWDPAGPHPTLEAAAGGTRIRASHPELGDYELHVGTGPGRHASRSCCSARTRPTTPRIYGTAATTPYPKDGINDHVVDRGRHGEPGRDGHEGGGVVPAHGRARRHRRDPAPPAAEAAGRRPGRGGRLARPPGRGVRRDDGGAPGGGRRLLRRPAAGPARPPTRRRSCARRSPGCCGASSSTPTTSPAGSTGDPASPPPPSERLTGRNAGWRHFDAADILSMPDKWEYPWFAAWDLAFHTITLAHVDPAFAKYQLLVMCREWFQHPNGALPAYEWSFDDVNPPVHALAALAVWNIDGRRDTEFLERIFHKLLLNFTWWLNREDCRGQRPVLGRLPRPRQPERLRPLPPAGGRQARAVRRDRLDVRLLHVDAARWPSRCPAATRPTATW